MSQLSIAYLDHNATTPLDSRVKEAMLPYMEAKFGNPSSVHSFGQEARYAVDKARTQVARLLNAEPEEILFTAGGTESCNTAILGFVRQHGTSSAIYCSAVEHPAVLRAVEFLAESQLAAATLLPVLPNGVLDQVHFCNAFKSPLDGAALVSVMAANNDVGTIMPISKLVDTAHAAGAIVHTDAVQAVGKIPVDVKQWNVDLLSCSAHKLRGPKGVGALYIKRGTRIAPIAFGGHQESRRRAGTENVAAIVGFGAACELALNEMADNSRQVAALKNELENELRAMDGVVIYGATTERLPGTCYAGFNGIEGETLQMALDMAGFAVSVGSACSSESRDPSHVLTAMGVDRRAAASAIRFSIGPSNSRLQIEELLTTLKALLAQLRS